MRSLSSSSVLLASLLLGCSGAGPQDDRASWLLEQMLRDNQRWLTRDPGLLAAKYQAMAAEPYNWMRGTAPLYYSDQARPGSPRVETAFLVEPEASAVLLMGDPHPENLTTVLHGEGPGPELGQPIDGTRVTVEWVDLDAAAWGPWVMDLRRSAVGTATFVRRLSGCGEGCAREVVQALGWAYADEVLALDARESTFDPGELRASVVGEAVRRLLREAWEEGPERKRLGNNTQLQDGERALIADEALDEEGKGHFEPDAVLAEQFERLAAAYAESPVAPGGFRVLGRLRRFGSGISSLPAVRFVVHFDRGEPGWQDDELLQFRETVDPPVQPGALPTAPGLFDDGGARMAEGPRLLWSDPAAGPRAWGMQDGEQVWKVLSWSSWHQGLELEKVAEDWDDGDIVQADLVLLGEFMGRMLAGAHGRGPTASGSPGSLVIADDLRAGAGEEAREVLAAELTAAALPQTDTVFADHALFLELLDAYGPLLGAEVVRND